MHCSNTGNIEEPGANCQTGGGGGEGMLVSMVRRHNNPILMSIQVCSLKTVDITIRLLQSAQHGHTKNIQRPPPGLTLINRRTRRITPKARRGGGSKWRPCQYLRSEKCGRDAGNPQTLWWTSVLNSLNLNED